MTLLLTLIIAVTSIQLNQSNHLNSRRENHQFGELFNKRKAKDTYECPEKPSNNLHDLSEGVYYFSSYSNIYACNQNLLRINSYKCALFVYSSRFTSIRSYNSGGGAIYLSTTEDSKIFKQESYIENCIFTNGSDASFNSGGGAIFIGAYKRSYFYFHLISNVFKGNSAPKGGAIYFEAVNGNINSNRFIDNIATDAGSSIYFYFQVSDQNSKSVSVNNNMFEHSSIDSKSLICFYSTCIVLFEFSDNTINITSKSETFHVFSSDILYNNKKNNNFTRNCIFPPLGDDRSILNDRLFNLDLTNSFESFCTTSLPEERPDPTEPIPDVILNNDNCNRNNRCNYSVYEKRNVFVLVSVTYFSNFYQQIENGGAIYILNCGIQCKGASFTNCSSATGGGGAIYIKNVFDVDNNVSLVSNKFIQCSAVFGGALYLYSGSELADVLIKICTFEYNEIMNNNDSELKGGSACFLAIKRGSFAECNLKAGRKSGNIMTISNNFDNNQYYIKKLSNENSLFISNCSFVVNETTKNAIYFINQDGQNELRDCKFNGKLNINSNYIDGDSFSRFSHTIKIIKCKFEYSKNDFIILKYGIIITAIGILAFFIFLHAKKIIFYDSKGNLNENHSIEKHIKLADNVIVNVENI